MLNFSRISAIVYRNLIPILRDPARAMEILYWPVVDLGLFGFMGLWAQEKMASPNFMAAVLISVICWFLIYRSSLEITRNLLVEIWEHHLVNLFACPLQLFEFFIGLMLVGILPNIVTFLYSGLIVWLMFSVNIFAWVPTLLPFLPLFIISGWVIALFVSSMILYFGKSAEAFVWALPWLFAIFSGAYSPISFLPLWMQKVAFFLPFSHFFTIVREIILNNNIPVNDVLIGTGLLIFYLIAGLILISYTFNKSKDKGLSNLG